MGEGDVVGFGLSILGFWVAVVVRYISVEMFLTADSEGVQMSLVKVDRLSHALSGRKFRGPSMIFIVSPCDMTSLRFGSPTRLDNHVVLTFWCIVPES